MGANKGKVVDKSKSIWKEAKELTGIMKK